MKKRKFYVNQVGVVMLFELDEPEFYKLVTTITRDDESRKFYTVPVGRCNQLKKFEDSLSANHSFRYRDDDDGDYRGDNIGYLLKNMRMHH